ncbi:GMC oxidoreductase [Novosphingobium resinovorum]
MAGARRVQLDRAQGPDRQPRGHRAPCLRRPARSAAYRLRPLHTEREADLTGLVEGLEMARALARPLIARGVIAEEELPGPHLTGAPLRDWVRANAWGHHACGSAAIGPVLDPSGRVHGIERLRVVDASIFPRIPGLFIAAPIYLAAEKLAADILRLNRES